MVGQVLTQDMFNDNSYYQGKHISTHVGLVMLVAWVNYYAGHDDTQAPLEIIIVELQLEQVVLFEHSKQPSIIIEQVTQWVNP